VKTPEEERDIYAHELHIASLRVAELERERDEARERVLVMSDAWKAAMDNVARLREALTQVRDAMLATGQEPDGDDDPRRPVATAVWRALASAPSAAPTPRDMRVASAVREACINAFCVPFWEQRTPQATLRSLDLAAVVAKAVGL